MVNIADIRSHLETVETAERNLALIQSFAAKGGAYKLGVTVDTKEAWDGAQIAGIISQYLTKMPILESTEKFLNDEIEAAKKALVEKAAGESRITSDFDIDRAIEAVLSDAGKITSAAEAHEFLRRAK